MSDIGLHFGPIEIAIYFLLVAGPWLLIGLCGGGIVAILARRGSWAPGALRRPVGGPLLCILLGLVAGAVAFLVWSFLFAE